MLIETGGVEHPLGGMMVNFNGVPPSKFRAMIPLSLAAAETGNAAVVVPSLNCNMRFVLQLAGATKA
jgi:hypothetical protein